MSESTDFGLEDARSRSLEWLRFIYPVTEHFADQVRREDFSGLSMSCWMHLLPDAILILEPFVEAGVTVRVGACNPDSTNSTVVEMLRARGVEVYSGGNPVSDEYQDILRKFVNSKPDVICDMGGELTEMANKCGVAPKGALEATITGLHRLAGLDLGFPVFDWNSVPIKDSLHNRFHVGDSTWPAFTAMTGITMFGRKVLVVGFGPVGRGVAERARSLGAVVMVAELDPVRSLEAQHFGCEVVPLAEGLGRAEIIVTATGIDGVIKAEMVKGIRAGAILFNVGHSNREIDVAGISKLPVTEMKRGIHRYDTGGGSFFLLNNGSMVNLAHSTGLDGANDFDPFAAIMVAGMHWVLSGRAGSHSGGLHPYPDELLKKIATAALARGMGGS